MSRTRRRSALVLGLSIALTAVAGCGPLRKAEVPMPSRTLHEAQGDRCLAVLLPGRGSGPAHFERAGFGRAVAERGLEMDVVAVDAHLGYYRKRTVVDRLREDVLAPARRTGYSEIWLAGPSLGGIGTLLYLRFHPEDLDGIFALAPFLGKEAVIDEIEAVGGPLAWEPPAEIARDDVGRELWSWLAPFAAGEEAVPLHLGWGTRDAFDRSSRLLASLLPDERVYTRDGGHDWKVWGALWEDFLDRARPCAAGARPTRTELSATARTRGSFRSFTP